MKIMKTIQTGCLTLLFTASLALPLYAQAPTEVPEIGEPVFRNTATNVLRRPW